MERCIGVEPIPSGWRPGMLPLNTSTASFWGGAGNRTLALTFTASRAATDTSATSMLVWALGFEPRTSSVRGRHSGQAELHPVTAIWSSVPDSNRDHSLIGRRSCQLDEPTVISPFLSASRLSFRFTTRWARPGSGLIKLLPRSAPDPVARVAGLAPAGVRFGDGAAPVGSPTRIRAHVSWLPGQASNLERPD